LTEQEVKLLELFISNRGKPVSRSKILEIGWGYPRGMKTRTVDNFIVRFRKYFEDNPKKPVFFKSLRSVGYVFDHESESKEKPVKISALQVPGPAKWPDNILFYRCKLKKRERTNAD